MKLITINTIYSKIWMETLLSFDYPSSFPQENNFLKKSSWQIWRRNHFFYVILFLFTLLYTLYVLGKMWNVTARAILELWLGKIKQSRII